MITAAQLRAARGFLDLSRRGLASASGLAPETIRNIEERRVAAKAATVEKITLTFSRHGLGFFEILTRNPVWGVVLQPPHAPEQDNRSLTAAAHQEQEHMTLAARIAKAIAATIRQRGSCRPRDLAQLGFADAEITEAWNMACALAQVRLEGGDE
jgi:DNA-binding XRE family transcriptional regulator